MTPEASAQTDDTRAGDDIILEQLNTTRIGYVLTGEDDVDNVSERGLAGLAEFLAYRTSLEPGAPAGLDIETDQLSFFPLIYWPVSATAPMPSAQAISRIVSQVLSISHQRWPWRAERGSAWWLLCQPSPLEISPTRRLLRLSSSVS